MSTYSHVSLLQAPAAANVTSAQSNLSAAKLGSSKVINSDSYSQIQGCQNLLIIWWKLQLGVLKSFKMGSRLVLIFLESPFFTSIMLFDLKSLKQDSIHGSTEYLINVANRMFDFPQLISKRLTSPDFWSHQKYCNDYSPLRLRLLQTRQSQQTSLPTNAAVPRWADLMLTILQILLRQWRTWNHLWLSPQLNSSLALSLTFIFISGFTVARFPSSHLAYSGCYRTCQASRQVC